MINRESLFQRRLEITPKKQKTIKTINKTWVKGFLNEVRKKGQKLKWKQSPHWKRPSNALSTQTRHTLKPIKLSVFNA